MKLLVVRHAIAEDREVFAATGRPDAERPLTPRGRRRMRRGARGLRRLVPEVDLLASSPLLRARQTADVLARVWPDAVRAETELLSGAHPAHALAPWLDSVSERPRVAVVGHEPHLSDLVCWLTAGTGHAFATLGKGGACLLGLPGPVAPGGAELEWMMRPGQLRRLG